MVYNICGFLLWPLRLPSLHLQIAMMLLVCCSPSSCRINWLF